LFSSPGTYHATLLALRERLTAVRHADRPRLARELDRLFARKTLDAQAHKAADALGKAIDDSVARVERLRSLSRTVRRSRRRSTSTSSSSCAGRPVLARRRSCRRSASKRVAARWG
jgi:hypothetical protein